MDTQTPPTRSSSTRRSLSPLHLVLIIAIVAALVGSATPLAFATDSPTELTKRATVDPKGFWKPLGSTFDGPDAIAPPLPSDCSELAPPGGDPPASCVYGYVYFDGSPVISVTVTIRSPSAIVNVTTQSGPGSPQPYFAAALSEPPLDVLTDELVVVETTYNGETNSTTFTAVADGQQVDLWLSSACGPTTVGGVIASDVTWTRDCGPYIVTDNVLVFDGWTLVIESGTTVKFEASTALRIDGELLAQGLANGMIRFTSNVGQVPGDWAYILFGPSSVNATFDAFGNYLYGSTVQYAVVEYAGGAAVSDNAAVRADAAKPYLTHLTVRHSASDGVRFYNGGGAQLMDYSALVDNAEQGIYVNSDTPDILFAYNTVARNHGGGLYARGGTTAWIISNTIAYNEGGAGIHTYQTPTRIGYNTICGNANPGGNGGGIYSYGSDVDVTDNLITGNSARHGGGIYRSGTSIMNDNVFAGNIASRDGGGIYYTGSGWINLNVVVDNLAERDGGGVYLTGTSGDRYLHVNAILDNRALGQGGGLYTKATNLSMRFNTVIGNDSGTGLGGTYIKNHPLFFLENNLYNNSDYDLFNGNAQGDGDLLAELNWWGTIDTLTILENIWDFLDDSTLTLVDFDPSLAQHELEAPISPPTGLTAIAVSDTITLTWSANPESDLVGYRVHYDADAAGFPYEGTGAAEGDAPIDVGDTTTATLTGLAPGTYHLSITAYDNDADGESDQTEGHESWFAHGATAFIGEMPDAGFTGSPTSGAAPLTVGFNNVSTGDYTSCLWDFGDDTATATCGDPDHTYNVSGIYTVSLTVSGLGQTDTFTRGRYITVYPAPVDAAFSASPTEGVKPLTVDFTNASTGEFDTCDWRFGDGGSSNRCDDPSYTFRSAGVFTVSLTVSGPGGTDTLTRKSYITVYESGVHAGFVASPTSGIAPLAVVFTDTSSGDINTWDWDFGDQGQSSLQNPVYTYLNGGVYTVTLAVNGPGGTDSLSKPNHITVYEPVDAGFSASPTSGAYPLAVRFTNESTGAYDTCAWTFGDGGESSDCDDPSHTYDAAGNYTVSLFVSGPGGSDTDTRVDYITVAEGFTVYLPTLLRN